MRRECRERFPRHWFQRKMLVSDPGMHHSTCATHVPWCMSGSLHTRWWGKRSRHLRRMRNPQFYVSGKRPMENTSMSWRHYETFRAISLTFTSLHAMGVLPKWQYSGTVWENEMRFPLKKTQPIKCDISQPIQRFCVNRKQITSNNVALCMDIGRFHTEKTNRQIGENHQFAGSPTLPFLVCVLVVVWNLRCDIRRIIAHWPPGDALVVSNMKSQSSCSGVSSWALLVKLLSG